MKTNNLFRMAMLLISIILVTGCANNEESNDFVTPESNINVEKGVEFTVDFADFNADEEVDGTRVISPNDTVGQETVELSNGLLANVTIRKDREKHADMPLQTTRALSNDIYRMYAYQGNTIKGTLTGTVTGGVFHPISTNKEIVLAPGAYTFILINSKVSVFGNELRVSSDNALTAMVGRTTQTITATPRKQKVKFQMKHTGSRMCVCLIANMPIPTTVKASVTSTIAIPRISRSHIVSGGNTIHGWSGQTQHIARLSPFPEPRLPTHRTCIFAGIMESYPCYPPPIRKI